MTCSDTGLGNRRHFEETLAKEWFRAVRNWYKHLIEAPASLALQAAVVQGGPMAARRA